MSQELGTEARALLARARHSSDPSASDRWAVRRGLAKQIVRVGAASAALTASISTTKAGAALAGGLKFTLLTQFGLATVAGATLASSAMFVHTSVMRTPVDPPALMVQAPHSHPTLRPSSPAAIVNAAPEPLPSTENAAPNVDSSNADPPRQVDSEPIDRSPGALHESTSTSKPQTTADRSSASPVTATREARQQAVISAPAGLRDEGRALAEVQHALSEHRGADALRLLELQSKRFADGSLVQERAAARVFALCELGRRGEARVAADGFAHAWPDSPLLGRVLLTCK